VKTHRENTCPVGLGVTSQDTETSCWGSRALPALPLKLWPQDSESAFPWVWVTWCVVLCHGDLRKLICFSLFPAYLSIVTLLSMVTD
jgi:hypothetical protein